MLALPLVACGQYHLAIAGGCEARLSGSQIALRTHPLPRGGTDCIQACLKKSSTKTRGGLCYPDEVLKFSKHSLHKHSLYFERRSLLVSSSSLISAHQQPFNDMPQTKSLPQDSHFKSLPPETIALITFSTLLILTCGHLRRSFFLRS